MTVDPEPAAHPRRPPPERRARRGSTAPRSTDRATWTRRPSGPRPTRSSTSWPTTSRASSDRPVFPAIEPGSLRPLFPAAPPEQPEPLEAILADYAALVEPNATHWQHPGFLAYFATTASGPGILGEMLTAALGQNPMLWRTSPIGTELEDVVVDWLRQALGLPASRSTGS